MAVEQTYVDANFRLGVKSGVDDKGKDVIKNISVNAIDCLAGADDVVNLSNALQSLVKYPMKKETLIQKYELTKI